MADKKQSSLVQRMQKRFNRNMDGVTSLLDDMSITLYGTRTRDESDRLNDRFNEIMSEKIDGITGNGTNDYTTFIGQLFDSNKPGSSGVISTLNSKLDLDARGNGMNPEQFITDQYKNRMLKQADAHQIANQLIELNEAKSVMRDAILSADLNTGRINRTISFDKTTVNDVDDDWIPVIENMEKHLDLPKKIKDFIVDNTLSFGEYYVYHIPYHELFSDFAKRYAHGKRESGRGLFFESADLADDIETLTIEYLSTGTSKEDKVFMEDVTDEIASVLGYEKKGKDKTEITDDLRKLISSDRITVSTSHIPIPFIESGENGFEMYQEFAEEFLSSDCSYFTEDGSIKKEPGKPGRRPKNPKEGKKLDTDEDAFLRAYGNSMYDNEGVYKQSKDEKFEDIKDCYMKMVEPTRMLPVEIMGHTMFYLYIQTEEAAPLQSILSYQTQMKTNDPSNKLNTLVDEVASKVVSKFDKNFVAKNKDFKDLIVAALSYYDMGNTKIHFQLIPKEYVTAFKINVDAEGHGHSMLEPSLFYAKLYLMMYLFKIVTMVTKSNDQQINYIRQSGIDKETYNKAQRIIRQKQARRITVNDMFSYTGVINKIASGSEVYMPLGKNGEKPIETEILSGQSVDMNNDFMETTRNNYILATGVPSAIMNYLNEADFAKSIETANTKMNGRVINYQIDLNEPLTKLYQTLARFTTSMPEEVIQSLRVTLPEPKGTSNITTQELINNYTTLQEFLVKLHFGESPDDDVHVKLFIKELASLHLPMINFDKIEEIYKRTKMTAEGKKVNAEEDDMDVSGNSDNF